MVSVLTPLPGFIPALSSADPQLWGMKEKSQREKRECDPESRR